VVQQRALTIDQQMPACQDTSASAASVTVNVASVGAGGTVTVRSGVKVLEIDLVHNAEFLERAITGSGTPEALLGTSRFYRGVVAGQAGAFRCPPRLGFG